MRNMVLLSALGRHTESLTALLSPLPAPASELTMARAVQARAGLCEALRLLKARPKREVKGRWARCDADESSPAVHCRCRPLWPMLWRAPFGICACWRACVYASCTLVDLMLMTIGN